MTEEAGPHHAAPSAEQSNAIVQIAERAFKEGYQPGVKPESGLAEELVKANYEIRAKVISNLLMKSAIGLGAGVGLSLLIFKRRLFPVTFATGVGVGIGYSDGRQIMREFNEEVIRQGILLSKSLPSNRYEKN